MVKKKGGKKVGAAAEVKAKATTAQAEPDRNRPANLHIRTTLPWRDWVERAAAHSRLSVSAFMDRAAAMYAKAEGFKEPPPDR